MITALLVLSILNFLTLIYVLLVMNGAFTETNTNIDSHAAKLDILIKAADKVIAKHNQLTSAIGNEG